MALVTCSDCGKDVSDRAAACPNCGGPMREDDATPADAQAPTVPKVDDAPPADAQSPKARKVSEQEPEVRKAAAVHPTYKAGEEAGYGCMMLATSAPVAYIAFILVWMLGGIYLADRTGLYVEGEETSLWVGFAILVLPFILVVVLRKPIRAVMSVILGSGCLIVLLLPALVLSYWVIGEALQLIFGRSGP